MTAQHHPEGRDLGQTARRWEDVEAALKQASEAWREVSPTTTGPIEEMHTHAQRNVIYWGARSNGLDDVEASRETEGEVPGPAVHYIDFDGIWVDPERLRNEKGRR